MEDKAIRSREFEVSAGCFDCELGAWRRMLDVLLVSIFFLLRKLLFNLLAGCASKSV